MASVSNSTGTKTTGNW